MAGKLKVNRNEERCNTMSMILEVIHVDTCLPDYWGGHHKAHICVPVWNGITFDQLKRSLHSEIAQGAVYGSDTIAELLSIGGDFSDEEISIADQAAHDAVDAITLSESANPDHLFANLDDDGETVYVYFLIVDTES